jgi:hypothetical protein
MAKPKLSNVFVVGVEWGAQNHAVPKTTTDRLAEGLLVRFERGQIRATWAVSDFRSRSTERIRNAAVAQEIALDATVHTPRDAQHAPAFSAWLKDHCHRAEQEGIGIRSLVLDDRGRAPYQMIAQRGFRTLRTCHGPMGRVAEPVQPQSLRFGLWGLPVSLRWPHPGRRWPSFWRHPMAYCVRHTVLVDAVLHVVFDLSAMAAVPADSALGQVDRLLNAVVALGEGRQLTSARLVDIDRLVRRETTAQPTRSILREAA